MTAVEIASLRTKGQLQEAYNAAIEAYPANPDTQLQCIMGWILYDRFCDFMEHKDYDSAFSTLEEWCQRNITDSAWIYNKLTWQMRAYLAEEVNNSHLPIDIIRKLLVALIQLPIPKPDKSMSALLNTVLKLNQGKGFEAFFQQCGMESLLPEDYNPFETKDGKKLMSLAEKVNCQICKHMLTLTDKDVLLPFIEQQNTLQQQQPSFAYIPYYSTKILLNMGENTRAIETLKPFAKRKAHDFWVWQLLAEAQLQEEDRLPFFCKALLCPAKPTFLVGLYEQVAVYMAQQKYNQEARWLADKAYDIRRQNNWKIPQAIFAIQRLKWYNTTPAVLDKKWLQEHAEQADTYLFGQHTVLRVTVVGVNTEKRFVSFIAANHKRGFFKCPKYMPHLPNIKDALDIDVYEIPAQGPTHVRKVMLVKN